MKHIKRMVGMLLSVVMLFSAVLSTGCTQSDNPTEEKNNVAIVAEGVSDYIILYPKDAGSTVIRYAEQLRDTIREKTGAVLDIASVDKYTGSGKEILIGEMDERQITIEIGKTVRAADYVIEVTEDRVVIVGGDETQMVSAIRKIINDYVNTAVGNTLTLPVGELVRRNGTYAVTELKLGGVDISEYQIVYSAFREDTYRTAIEEFQARLRLLCGARLKAVSSSAPSAEYEIQFGDCGRGVSKGLTAPKSQYALSSDGKSVALVSGDSLIAKWSVRSLLEQYFPVTAAGKVEISLPVTKIVREQEIGKPLIEGADLRIMSSNMLFLKESNGAERAKLLKDIYLEYYPDVIGLQECDPSGHTYVVTGLKSYYAVACSTVGETDTRNYTPILYRPDRCQLLESGSYLLDKRPTDSYPLSYAVFKHLPTGKTFAVIDLHAVVITTGNAERLGISDSVEGKAWREDNSRQILEQFDQLQTAYGKDLPVFIMGDMNTNANSESVKMIDAREELGNCIDLATVSKSTGIKSGHDLGVFPQNGSPIDHMFVTKDTVQVYTHYLNTSTDALKASDHCQLICEFAWKS